MIVLVIILAFVLALLFLSHLLKKQAQKHAVEVSEHLLVNLLQEDVEDLQDDAQEELWKTYHVFSNVYSRAKSPDGQIHHKELLTQVVRIVKLVDLLASQYKEQNELSRTSS